MLQDLDATELLFTLQVFVPSLLLVLLLASFLPKSAQEDVPEEEIPGIVSSRRILTPLTRELTVENLHFSPHPRSSFLRFNPRSPSPSPVHPPSFLAHAL